jgi:diadenosine tetraphosphate (Ap4A) HIT family hydrolase
MPDISPRSRRKPEPDEPRDCPFCGSEAAPARYRDRIVFEDPRFLVTHVGVEGEPTYLGLLQLQTRRHVPGFAELTEREAAQLGSLVRGCSRALKSCTPAAWTYVYGFTEAFRHVHLFIAARYPGMPEPYVRLGIANWPEAPRGGAKEVTELVIRLREALRIDGPPRARRRARPRGGAR